MVKQNQYGDNPEIYAMPTSVNWHATAAADTAVTIVLAAVVGRRQCCTKLGWSHDNTPTGGRLYATTGGEVIFDVDITTGGPGWFPYQLRGKLNQDLTIHLAAAGAGVIGKLNVEKAWQEQ